MGNIFGCNCVAKNRIRCKNINYTSLSQFGAYYAINKGNEGILIEKFKNEYNIPPEEPGLPSELWIEVIQKLKLLEIGNLHLTCKYFYVKIKTDFFEKKNYHTVLLDNMSRTVSGNDFATLYKVYTTTTRDEYIINNIIVPYGVPESSCDTRGLIKPLITTIASYDQFIRLMKEMKTKQHQEDLVFPDGPDMRSRVREYCDSKTVEDLFNYITKQLIGGGCYCTTHRIALASGVQVINWNNSTHIITRLCQKLRELYPNFIMFLPLGCMYYSMNGLKDFEKY